MGYGGALGSGKAEGETTGGIKQPKLPSITNSAGAGGTIRGGAVKMQPPPRATPIKQAPQGPGRMPPQTGTIGPGPAAPGFSGGPTTRASRLAAAQKLYAPDGAGWAGMGTQPPPVGPGEGDPWGSFGSAGNPGGMPGTGGGFMAGAQPPPFAPGPPQQADPPMGGGRLPPELMNRIQMLMQTNPQVLLRALGMA